ncbi:MAG: hypothetical protein HQ581_21330 [Planctomycetes bacterium]|nr:hypothetical protein [Planctomycetota bacterium]
MTRLTTLPRIFAVTLLLATATAAIAAPEVEVSSATRAADGFLMHKVRSPFQSGETSIRVLLPDRLEEGKRYAVVYVLPVEAADGHHYGDGLAEIKRRDLHNTHDLICVYPTFSHLPWYADHPTDPAIRQESYLRKVVVPYVDATYPTRATAEGRLLLGFSKSGWGAFCLILRNPAVFGKAAAWDAPMEMSRPGQYGSGPIFGSAENFQQYQVTRLLAERGEPFRKSRRLALLGYGNFRNHHQQTHQRMTDLAISHAYADGPYRKHDWHSGWVAEAVEFLAGGQE